MKIRPFAPTDLVAVYAVQLQCPEAAQWHREDYAQLANLPGGMILVAEPGTASQSVVLGFAAFHHLSDEAELRNVAVDPEYRGRGVGRALLREGIRRLQELGTRRIFLEVRASNRPAVALYAAIGFKLVSTRKNYYQGPEEDACVMALGLTA